MPRYNASALCNFIPCTTEKTLNTLNFVHEVCPYEDDGFDTRDYYILYLVTDGQGVFRTGKREYALEKGDCFFTFPNKPYAISNTGKLKYMYISFVGIRAREILIRLGIDYNEPTVNGNSHLIATWQNEFNRAYNNPLSELIVEGLLLQSLSYFTCEATDAEPQKNELIRSVLSFVDRNYGNSDLNLLYVARVFHFNFNYLSQLFKSSCGVTFSRYLNTVRFQHAAELLKDGSASIKSIAAEVGFSNPYYFSRAFREHMSLSPTEYRERHAGEALAPPLKTI